jgi:small subunit ribosomal protein S4
MARYREAICRLCRREGQKLFLKGMRCNTNKCAMERRPYPPGQGGEARLQRRRVSDYGTQLREKQKLRQMYGVLEKQFRRYMVTADRAPGVTGEVLMQLLERRLDNVVFRAGMAVSRSQARQLITHGHFHLNGRRINVPSAQVKAGDVVKVKENSKKQAPFQDLTTTAAGVAVPEWLAVDLPGLAVTVVALPTRDQITTEIDEQQIVEFYSR